MGRTNTRTRATLSIVAVITLTGGLFFATGNHAWRVLGARPAEDLQEQSPQSAATTSGPEPTHPPAWEPTALSFRAVSIAGSGSDNAPPPTGAPVWGDVDGDGAPDLFVAGGDQGRSTLFLNREGRLSPAAPELLGLSAEARHRAAAFADFDDDGDRDLYLAGIGATPDELLRQLPDGRFEPATEEYGLSSPIRGRTRAASWNDLDGDGRLDLYAIRDGASDRFARRQAGATFVESALRAGLGGAFDARSVLVADLDGDRDLDVLASRDDPSFGDRYLFNRGDGSFVELPALPGQGHPHSSLCAAQGDVDQDGRLDLFLALAGGGGALLAAVENERGVRTFEDRSALAGLQLEGRHIESARFCDLDLDGALDLLAIGPRGLAFFRNQGGGSFRDETGDCGLNGYGAGGGRAFALADYDLDGDLDLALTGGGDGVLLLENQTRDATWLRVLAPGRSGNLDGLGATVRVMLADGRRLVRSLRAGGDEPVLSIGLAGAPAALEVLVEWTDGGRSRLQGVPAGIEWTVAQSSAPALASSHPAALLGEVRSFALEPALARAAEFLGNRLPAADTGEQAARTRALDLWIQSGASGAPSEEAYAAALQRIAQETRLEMAGRILVQSLRIPSEAITERAASRALEWNRPARLVGSAFFFKDSAAAERARAELAGAGAPVERAAALGILPVGQDDQNAQGLMHEFWIDAPTWNRLQRAELLPFEGAGLPEPGSISRVFPRGDGFGLLLVEQVLLPVQLLAREANALAEADLRRAGAGGEIDLLLGYEPPPAGPLQH